ncbi:hypothetical protein GCM10023169_01360 [Georgenia halophila]|uniref:histidine kinase n=1 Tax=Georgenia halophila TaxID=620889 RepID=A0ABP8KSI2_9MICO
MTSDPADMCVPSRPSVRVVVAAVVIVAVCAATATYAELQNDPATAVVTVDIVAGVLGVILVPVLVVRPVAAAVVLAVLAGLSPAATPAATAATLAVGRWAPFPVAVGVAALGALTHVVRGVWRPPPDLPMVWWVVLVVVAHAALLAWGALSRSRAQVLAALRERARRAESDRDRAVAEARAEERTRIAREMHDVLAHRLSLLATHAGALEFRPDSPPEQIARAAGVVRAGVHQALDELRDVIGVLRYEPPSAAAAGGVGAGSAPAGVPAPQPGADRLEDLVTEARQAGSAVGLELRLDGDAPGLVGRTTYRVVQEGLTNARKHAPGLAVEVSVTGREGEGVDVRVANPLPPSPVAAVPGSGTGLVGLEERLQLVGGRLEHGVNGRRFVLSAWLPWPP